MNARTLRRLALDHADLHKNGLPPNYLFPNPSASMPDDLSRLDILLAGPHGTPYSGGMWKLHLSIPQDYPKTPPKATFRTQLWHPNVDPATGAVCVETLKRDWDPKLTLRHILVTISCLLIYPNPDSALNAEASALQQDDYEMFARRARTMTLVQAAIPKNLAQAVAEAQRRGEDDGRPLADSSITVTKSTNVGAQSEDADDEADSSKENEPSRDTAGASLLSPNRSSVLGKRPLSELSDHAAMDPDAGPSSSSTIQKDNVILSWLTTCPRSEQDRDTSAPPRKSPKTAKFVQAHVFESSARATAVADPQADAPSENEPSDVPYKNGKPMIVNAPLGGAWHAKMAQVPKNSVWPRRGIYRL